MAIPSVTWLFNTTANDGENEGLASGGAGGSSSNWEVFDTSNDKFIWTSEEQNNNDSITGIVYPVPIPVSGNKEAPKTFVWDTSEGLLRQVPLAGTTAGLQSGGDTRYVFALYFSGPTDSIPYLEAWDNTNHSTADCAFLNHDGFSLITAVNTTNAAPGSDTWTGTDLKGTESRIVLDTAALAGGKNLYFNLKLVIPSGFTAQTYTAAVLMVRFLYS